MKRIIDSRKKEKFMVDDAYLNGQAKLCGHQATIAYISLCRHASKDQECFPSIKLMAEEHAVSTKTIQRGLKKLEERNVIKIGKKRTKDGKWLNNTYTLLDKSVWDYSQWTNSPVDSQGTNMNEPGDKYDASQETNSPTKETHSKETNKKETHTSELRSQVDKIMNIFYEINPTLNWGNKTSRGSAEFLIKKYGLEGTETMARQIIGVQGQPFCPVATTPHQMKEKLAQFKIFFDRKKNEVNKLKIATISEEDWNAL